MVVSLNIHCESGEGLCLQGQAASQTHNFTDTEPHAVIPPKSKKNHGFFPKQLRPDINTSLFPPTSVYIALFVIKGLSDSKESVNLDLDIG